jgi:hypothetical protein
MDRQRTQLAVTRVQPLPAPRQDKFPISRQIKAAYNLDPAPRILTRSPALSTIFFDDPHPLRSPIITEHCAAAGQITRAARNAAILAAP